jgi:drug/metabolite transporter (DMT)-like permease
MSQTLTYSLLVIVLWGLVPSFAKMGDLSGGLTTMYVNWFATFGVLAIMAATGATKEFKHSQPYLKLTGIGVIWPLVYSITYFTSINLGSSSMTTITNYSWPVFYLICACLFAGKRFSKQNWVIVLMAILAVAIPTFLHGNITMLFVPVMLGLVAAICQALFSLISESLKENDWLVTFVISVVTAVGSTIYVGLFESFVWPDATSLFFMAFIGILSNGIGFWAFLKASKVSNVENHKTLFLVLMCSTPLAQVALLPILGVENVSPEKWIGVVLITGALIAYRLYPAKPATA